MFREGDKKSIMTKEKYVKFKNYDEEYVIKHLMGPNCMRIVEELTEHMILKPGMKVLDLGCGEALTSVFLAKEFGVTVFATDLWIDATSNMERVIKYGLEDKVFPIHADARTMPYAKGFFDAVVSVDSFHYFGTDERYLPEYLLPLLKPGASIGIAMPGLTEEFDEVPEALKPYWSISENVTFHSLEYWKKLLSRTGTISIEQEFEMECHNDAWHDWFKTDKEFAKQDIHFYNADINHQITTIALIAKKLAI